MIFEEVEQAALGVVTNSRHTSDGVEEDSSPLDSTAFREIEQHLSQGHLDEAQRLLARIDDHGQAGSRYLAIRLLYLRDRLAPEAVVERLQELLRQAPDFPEALALLDLASAGVRGNLALGFPLSAPRREARVPSFPADIGDEWSSPETLPDTEAALESERPTWAPDTGFSTAATQFPPSPDGSRASQPPSRKIQVDTRDEPEANSDPAPRNPSLVPRSRPEGRYSLRSEFPAPRRERSLPPPPPPRTSLESFEVPPVNAPVITANAAERLSLPELNAPRIAHVESPEPWGRHAFDANATSGASLPPPSLRQSGRTDGRYSMRNAGVESVRPSLRNPQRSPQPLRSPSDAAGPPSRNPLHGPASSGGVNPPSLPFRVPRPPQVSLAEDKATSLETQLLRGDPAPAQREFEHQAELALARVDALGDVLGSWAEEASHLLMTSPVTHYFGPFERSLHSLARLDLALDALYYAPVPSPTPALVSVLGAYIGETLRTAHRGAWKSDGENLLRTRVLAGGYVWEPFRIAHERLTLGAAANLYQTLAPALAKEGTLAWFSCAKEHVPPPRLWSGPLSASVLTTLGGHLQDSIWSLACAQHFGSRLDGSVESLRALDPMMDILARSAKTLALEQPWVMRLTALATAYVGEVLKQQAGGYWTSSSGKLGEDPVVFRLGGEVEVTPMSNILGRIVTQKRFQLESYVRVLLRRME